MTNYDPGLWVQCRSQAHSGDRSRDMHTHLPHGSGRHRRPQAELRHHPWGLGRRQCVWGPRGGWFQPLRPMSTPRILAEVHLTLLICSLADIVSWSLWRLLGQMDHCSGAVALYSGSFVLSHFPKEKSWGTSKNVCKGKIYVEINRYCLLQKDLQQFSSGACPASDWALDIERL